MPTLTRTLVVGAVAILALAGAHARAASAETKKPNILVVLADDLGFSDLGCYGSEIATPTLDRLASGGVRFTQFYNTAKCHSSRVSLLTGRYCRQAGDVAMDRAVTIPEVLAPAGYFTAMTGKWHLAKQPTDFGFQRYFGHLSGATNYYTGDNSFRLNGQPWKVPAQGFYTTVANVDHALRFVGEARDAKKPWFLYVAFNAPHAPLQPLEADYQRYLGKYDGGWDQVRAARVAKQKQLGLFGPEVAPSPRPEHIPAWETLSPGIRNWEARRMAAYAALIDRVDREIGRLVADIERAGELDNTLIVFLSDNGACPYDRRTDGRDQEPYRATTRWSDSTGWAWTRNTPFRFYKQNQFEGGIATPAIVHWPAGLKRKSGAFVTTAAHLVDLLPTLAEIGGAKIPTTFPGREPTPLAGISLAPLLAGREVTSRPPIHLLFASDRGLRDGDWKLVSFQSGPWELYNMAKDRTELHNLAAEHPDILKRMIAQWHDMTANVLHGNEREQAPITSTSPVKIHREWSVFTSLEASNARHLEGKKKGAGRRAANAEPRIRARIGTKLAVKDGQLVLECSGEDPGLALDIAAPAAAGPYTLEFRVQSRATGEGEIFWTTDAETLLPRGGHLAFPVKHDGEWHPVSLRIGETKPLFALRLDPCAGPGQVRIAGLQLKDVTGKTVRSWP
ncbi:MAG: arylsulfatase [Opitutaceae bacterium]|nr:arylsulfatase [Opitutaceae bacterium]